MIIGLMGHKGAGKDAIASHLLARGDGWVRLAFADLLKDCVRLAFGMSYTQLHIDKEVVDPRWGMTPRQVLQECGTAWRKVHPDVWVREVVDQIPDLVEDGCHVVITDVRFVNEVAAIRAAGGVIWRVTRPGHDGDSHISERLMDSIAADYVIRNDGTLDELHRSVDMLVS